MTLLLTAILAFGIAAIGTRAAIPWLARLGAVAHENDRTMHKGVVPKGGGAPLLVAAAFAMAAVPKLQQAAPSWLALLLGTAVLAVVSWRDDLAHLPPWVRLTAHAAVAAMVVWAFPSDALFFQGWLPWPIDRLAAAVALAWMMNLYNFMDGINGIAGAETIAISLGYLGVAALAGMAPPYAPLAAALAGAAAGFLLWNARASPLVFLGDVGSVPLGFLAGVLMLDLAARGLWAAALILPAYFLFDATFTLLRRALRGERVWEAHRSHAYQRAAAKIGSHLAVVARIVIADAALIGAAMLSVSAPFWALIVAAVIVAVLMLDLESAADIRSSGSDRRRP